MDREEIYYGLKGINEELAELFDNAAGLKKDSYDIDKKKNFSEYQMVYNMYGQAYTEFFDEAVAYLALSEEKIGELQTEGDVSEMFAKVDPDELWKLKDIAVELKTAKAKEEYIIAAGKYLMEETGEEPELEP